MAKITLEQAFDPEYKVRVLYPMKDISNCTTPEEAIKEMINARRWYDTYLLNGSTFKNGATQCENGTRRSPEDVFRMLRSQFPKITYAETLKVLMKPVEIKSFLDDYHNKEESLDEGVLVPRFIYCPDIGKNRITYIKKNKDYLLTSLSVNNNALVSKTKEKNHSFYDLDVVDRIHKETLTYYKGNIIVDSINYARKQIGLEELPHVVSVYGSLLTGLHNHRLISDKGEKHYHKFIGHSYPVDTLYEMYDLGSYPGIKRSPNGTLIRLQTFMVSDELLQDIDALEGYREGSDSTFYDRKEITIEVTGNLIKSYIYEYVPDTSNRKKLTPPIYSSTVNWETYYQGKTQN